VSATVPGTALIPRLDRLGERLGFAEGVLAGAIARAETMSKKTAVARRSSKA